MSALQWEHGGARARGDYAAQDGMHYIRICTGPNLKVFVSEGPCSLLQSQFLCENGVI